MGGGPAGLSAALRLAQLQKQKGGEPLSIAVIEKAREAGAHQLSGALLDPSTLRDLIPDFQAKGAPLACEVQQDNIYYLTPKKKLRLPITPPPFQNHGNYIISLNQFAKWLAAQVEAEGIDLFWGFAGQSVLFDGHRVSASAPAIAASAATAAARRCSSRAPTSRPRSRSSPTACAATSPRS